jgi:catechol-2,3-dioxygenase
MLETAPLSTTIPVVDLARAKAFYQNTLGLTLAGEHPGGATFTAGAGTHLDLYQRPPTKADHTVASFKVSGIEQVMEDLRAKSVTFEEYDLPGIKTVNGLATQGTMKAAWFKDPEGNILCLNEIA